MDRIINNDTQLQDYLVEMWSSSLKINPDAIDPDAHFFSLGGYSLLAISVVTNINKDLDLNLPLDSILSFPSIRELTSLIKTFIKTSENSIALEEGEL